MPAVSNSRRKKKQKTSRRTRLLSRFRFHPPYLVRKNGSNRNSNRRNERQPRTKANETNEYLSSARVCVCVCVCACVPVAPHLPRSIFSTHFVRRSATQCSIGLVCFFYFLGLISTPASILTCSEARKQKYFVLPALDLVFYLVDGFDGSGVEALGEPRDRLFARPISLGESVECKYFFYAAEVVVAR